MKITPQQKKRIGIAGVLFSVFLFLVYGPTETHPKLLFFNTTASVPRGLYLRIPATHIKTGDYVVYLPTEVAKNLSKERGWTVEDNPKFIKRVGATPGQTWSVDPKNFQFYANSKYIGQAALYDSKDQPLPRIYGTFQVPEGEFLPVAEATASFDGRYTGTVPLENIEAKVIPILTEFCM